MHSCVVKVNKNLLRAVYQFRLVCLRDIHIKENRNVRHIYSLFGRIQEQFSKVRTALRYVCNQQGNYELEIESLKLVYIT